MSQSTTETTTKSFMSGKKKLFDTYFPIGISVANMVGVSQMVPPEMWQSFTQAGDWREALTKGLVMVMYFTPTIIAWASNMIHMKKETEIDLARIRNGPPPGTAAAAEPSAETTTGNSTADAASAKEEAAQAEYDDPPDLNGHLEYLKRKATGENYAFEVAESFDSFYNNHRLTYYHPDVRLDIAVEANDIAITLHRASFKGIVGIDAPAEGEITDHASKMEFRDKIVDSRQECKFPTEHDDFQLNNLLTLYEHRENLKKLAGKTVNWSKFQATCSELGRLGLAAV